MRHSATRALLERDDVIIVASVSCIYGIGSPETYLEMVVGLHQGQTINRAEILKSFVALQYRRNDMNFQRGSFRVRGDSVEIFPAHFEDRAWRLSLFGDEIEEIVEFDPLDRREDREARRDPRLRQQPLRDATADAPAGDQADQARPQDPARRADQGRQAARSAAPGTAHGLRSGDDRGDGLVRRHRELFALSDRPRPRRAAADLVRISAEERHARRRREPHHRAAVERHVSRRLRAQEHPRRVRLPPAVVHRQPPAQIRGMGEDAAADHVRLGDAGPMGARPHRRRVRRAGGAPDRADRSRLPDPPGRDPGRRSARRMPRRRRSRASACWSRP